MQGKHFIDSNVFLYALSEQDISKQKIASELVLADKGVISTQVINEVSNNLLKKLKLSEVEIVQFIESCYKRYEVIELSHSLLISAPDLRTAYKFSFYDSIIVAATLLANVSVLYSEDRQDGLIVSENLTFVNPFK